MGNEFLNETVRGDVESAPEINFAGRTIDHADQGKWMKLPAQPSVSVHPSRQYPSQFKIG
jgi:hypothetical protein